MELFEKLSDLKEYRAFQEIEDADFFVLSFLYDSNPEIVKAHIKEDDLIMYLIKYRPEKGSGNKTFLTKEESIKLEVL